MLCTKQFENAVDPIDTFMDDKSSINKRSLEEAYETEDNESADDTHRYVRQLFTLNQEDSIKKTPFNKLQSAMRDTMQELQSN